jgi:hypothetical protein
MTMGCRTLRLGLSLIVCAFVAACGGGGGSTPNTPNPPQSQAISFASAGPISSSVGTTVTNAASGGQGSGAISYASSNTAVGTVNATSGAVTVVAVGSTTITATKAADSSYSAATATYTINGTQGTQSVAFAAAGPLNVLIGSTGTNAASGGAGTGAITYASSNTNAVTVDANGATTAVGVGTATITATKAADNNYGQAQAAYTINSQTSDKVSAFIGATGAEVNLPASANGKQFGRARVSDCAIADTIVTCAGAELGAVNGASIADGRATLTTPAYYALVNGSTLGTPVDVRADRFGNRVGHAVVQFKNRYWVIGGGEPIWPNDASHYQYTPKADVWSSADGRTWKLETASAGFAPRWFHAAVVFNNRIWVISGSPPTAPAPPAYPWYTDVWSSGDGVTWQKEKDDALLPWWAASAYVVVVNNKMVAVSGGATYQSTDGAFAPLSAPGALSAITLGRQSATLTAYNNALWFIAGRTVYPINMPDTGAAQNDVWNSTDGGVTWNVVTAHAAFLPRYQHSAFVLNGKLWVVGGRAAFNGVPGKYVGDAWSTTDGVTWTKEIVNAVATSFLMPTLQEAGKVTMIGGLQAAFTSNTWQTTDGNNWYEITPFAQFGPRYTSGTEFNGQMWIIGGEASIGTPGPSVSNDVWRSSDGINWTRVATNGTIFPPRDRHAVAAFNNKLWVIGGWDELPAIGGGGTRFNDVWSSPDGVNWTKQIPAGGTIFSPRLGHAAVVYGGKLWVISGDVDSTPTMANDVWSTVDGTNWVKVTDTAAFPAREGHGVAVFNNAMWIVGGDDASGARSDVWKSTDGATWTSQGSLGTRPRTHHGLAVLNGRMYAVAGADGPYFGATQYNDVWSTADGTSWTQTTAAAAFPARGLFTLFVHSNEMWLAGGLAAGPFNDVWRSSDGAAWRVGLSLPITAPP